MGKQIPQLPPITTVLGTDLGYIRKSTGSLDYHIEYSDLADYFLTQSDYSWLTQEITGNHTLVITDKRNQWLSVTTSTNEIEITIPAAVSTYSPTRVAVYNQDNTTGRVKLIITGGSTYYLDTGQLFIIESQLITGSTYAWVVIQDQIDLTQFFQEDVGTSQRVPAGNTLYEFTNLSFKDSAGLRPIESSGIGYVPTSSSANLFTDRGILQSCGNCHISYTYTWGTKATFKMWIKPTFDLTPDTDIYILDSRSGAGSPDMCRFFYDSVANQFKFVIREDGGNSIVISTDTFTVGSVLRQWHSVVITYDRDNNDDADGLGNAQFYFNGVEQGGGVEGTKTKNGNGISNMALSDTILTFLSEYAVWYEQGFEGYFTQFLRIDDWNEDTTNYGGTFIPVPYFRNDRVVGIDHNRVIEDDFQSSIKARFQEIDIGSGWKRELRFPSGAVDLSSGATVQIVIPDTSELSQLFDTYDPVNIIKQVLFVFGPDDPSASNSRTRTVVGDIERETTAKWEAEAVVSAQGGNYSGTTINRGWFIIEYYVPQT